MAQQLTHELMLQMKIIMARIEQNLQLINDRISVLEDKIYDIQQQIDSQQNKIEQIQNNGTMHMTQEPKIPTSETRLSIYDSRYTKSRNFAPLHTFNVIISPFTQLAKIIGKYTYFWSDGANTSEIYNAGDQYEIYHHVPNEQVNTHLLSSTISENNYEPIASDKVN